MGKTHSWINSIHINKGNITDLQNDTFLLAQQPVRLKGISKFSREVSAPKAIKWMFGTACRSTGQRDPWTHKTKTEFALMGTITSFKGLKFFLSSFINFVFGNQLKPRAHTGSLCVGGRTVQLSPVPVWVIRQSVVPWHIQGACYLQHSTPPIPSSHNLFIP